jgi:hypothetical protein
MTADSQLVTEGATIAYNITGTGALVGYALSAGEVGPPVEVCRSTV